MLLCGLGAKLMNTLRAQITARVLESGVMMLCFDFKPV